jgi:hypothetical protein
MLSNFQLEDHALLQSFLVGQPEFRSIMQSPEMVQLRQRVIASYHLGPLDVAETQAYVEHRLTCVGWKGNPGFDPEAMKGIFTFSQGIPRRINALADRVMLAAFLGENRRVTADMVDQIAAEMREEHVVPESAVSRSSPALLATSSGVAAGVADLQRLLSDPDAAKTLAGAGPGFDATRFEERLALLERTLSTTLNAISQLIGAAQQQAAGSESGAHTK